MALTKEQNDLMSKLLKLDTLAYFPEFSSEKYRTVGDFISAFNESTLPSSEECFETVFNDLCSDKDSGVWDLICEIQNDTELMNMEIVYNSESSDMYSSVCLIEDEVDADGNKHRNIYVILGGNYGVGEYDSDGDGIPDTSTWVDNVLGGIQEDTTEQQKILEFYDDAINAAKANLSDSDTYSITVSGHSKAGNLAQYITLMRDEVSDCYSFDGQGFSDAFIKKYTDVIIRNGSKINNVYPKFSFVGALLNPIENANNVFIDTGVLYISDLPSYSVIGYHLPTAMLDDNGNMKSNSNDFFWFSSILHEISIKTIKIADSNPAIDAERGLENLGYLLLRQHRIYPNFRIAI